MITNISDGGKGIVLSSLLRAETSILFRQKLPYEGGKWLCSFSSLLPVTQTRSSEEMVESERTLWREKHAFNMNHSLELSDLPRVEERSSFWAFAWALERADVKWVGKLGGKSQHQLSDNCEPFSISHSCHWSPFQMDPCTFRFSLHFGDISNFILKLGLMTEGIKVGICNMYFKRLST